jgi:hypothetical protein
MNENWGEVDCVGWMPSHVDDWNEKKDWIMISQVDE